MDAKLLIEQLCVQYHIEPPVVEFVDLDGACGKGIYFSPVKLKGIVIPVKRIDSSWFPRRTLINVTDDMRSKGLILLDPNIPMAKKDPSDYNNIIHHEFRHHWQHHNNTDGGYTPSVMYEKYQNVPSDYTWLHYVLSTTLETDAFIFACTHAPTKTYQRTWVARIRSALNNPRPYYDPVCLRMWEKHIDVVEEAYYRMLPFMNRTIQRVTDRVKETKNLLFSHTPPH